MSTRVGPANFAFETRKRSEGTPTAASQVTPQFFLRPQGGRP